MVALFGASRDEACNIGTRLLSAELLQAMGGGNTFRDDDSVFSLIVSSFTQQYELGWFKLLTSFKYRIR